MALRGWWMLALASVSVTSLNCAPATQLPPRADFSRPGRAQSSIPSVPGPLAPPSVRVEPPAFEAAARSNPWQPAVPEREWTSIVIHHTATDHGSVESIHESHLRKKWLGIGYHFVIGNGSGMADGAIEPTFRWREQLHGAHAGDDEYNQHGIGIALIGNFETERPSPAQLAAVKRLVGTLRGAYGIPAERVVGHGDVKVTACPGRYFPLDDVRGGAVPQLSAARSGAAVLRAAVSPTLPTTRVALAPRQPIPEHRQAFSRP